MKSRIEFEKDTVYKMIKMYCKGHNHASPLCVECNELFEYAVKRLELCPFAEEKTFCSKCPIHCYSKDKRENIKKVMAWSGPRMIFHHPLAAIFYLIKKL